MIFTSLVVLNEALSSFLFGGANFLFYLNISFIISSSKNSSSTNRNSLTTVLRDIWPISPPYFIRIYISISLFQIIFSIYCLLFFEFGKSLLTSAAVIAKSCNIKSVFFSSFSSSSSPSCR